MKKSDLKNKILKIIKGQKLIALATIKGKKPWVRFVVNHNKGFRLYVATYASSGKVKQIQKNPDVHVVVLDDYNSNKTPYVQIDARAKIKTDKKIRQEFWFKYMNKYYDGIDDPEYVVIEIIPKYIEYWESEFKNPQILKLKRDKLG